MTQTQASSETIASTVSPASFGFLLQKATPPQGFHKVLITGLGRSGTSALASMLRYAGFYLGEVEESATREDRTLRDMLKNGRIQEVKALLTERLGNHPLVAWKDPKLVGPRGAELLASLSEDWAVIVVFRDPLAMALRLVAEHGGDAVRTLAEAVENQAALVRFAESTGKTTLLVSYEKLMAEPIDVCRDVLDSLDPTLTPSIDFTAFWQKTKADQDMYRAHAERSRRAF